MPGAGDDSVDGNGGGFDYLDLSDAAGPAVFDMITGTATGNGTDTFADVEGFVGTDAGDSVLLDDLSGTPVDFIGGAGVDTVDASASALGVVIDLSLYTSAPPDVEDVTGGSGGDLLTGNALGNKMWGNDGFDTITAGAGNDWVEGGLGNDTLTGGLGADTISFKNATGGEEIDNQLAFATGPDGEDSMTFFEIILGSNFADTIRAGQTSLDANQRILGRGGDDDIVGSNSSDLLKAGGGDDTVRAGGGDDTLKGAAGNDLLVGGRGFDLGYGGKGNDTCKGVERQRSC
jgi:Ca2+-binding RTX toxin-like protein